MTELVPASRPRALDRAVAALAAGEVIVIPTDTVYGVAVDPFVPGATERLFAAKRRPRDVTLPMLVGDAADVERIAEVTPVAHRLMARFWPGPLTIVLDRVRELTADLGANEKTVGVRCPDHAFARVLLRAAGPLAVTSANLHGADTPPTAQETAAVFGASVSVVIDGGRCEGAPSTVVDCTADRVVAVREGRVPLALLADS